MQFVVTNAGSNKVCSSALLFARVCNGDNKPSETKSNRISWFDLETKNRKPLYSFEHYVGMELSMVPEVESVFVEWDKENGKAYHVVSIINARDPEARAKVYRREQAIMDEFPAVDFNFRVIARMNRKLSEVVNQVGKLAFQR
jgi:hypothetical protein